MDSNLVVQACNSSTLEVKTRRSEVQGHHQRRKFEANLEYMTLSQKTGKAGRGKKTAVFIIRASAIDEVIRVFHSESKYLILLKPTVPNLETSFVSFLNNVDQMDKLDTSHKVTCICDLPTIHWTKPKTLPRLRVRTEFLGPWVAANLAMWDVSVCLKRKVEKRVFLCG